MVRGAYLKFLLREEEIIGGEANRAFMVYQLNSLTADFY